LCNKSDHPTAVEKEDIRETLDLNRIQRRQEIKYTIHKVSALDSQGIETAFTWLATNIRKVFFKKGRQD
jgi:hypothetical protein